LRLLIGFLLFKTKSANCKIQKNQKEETFMNEQNPNFNEPSQTDWQAPPLPEQILKEDEQPQMSEAATLGNIFVSPGETFTDLRRKPRFLLALLLMMIVTTAFQFLFVSKMGDERMRSAVLEQMEKNPQVQGLPAEQKQNAVDSGIKVGNIVRYLFPVFLLIGVAIGALIYWGASKAMGGDGSFKHAVSAFVYSSFPPTMVAMLANILILFLKSSDEIDIGMSQRGLIHANPSFFLDGKTMPVLATLVGTLDFFQIWGWILAAIGLQKLMKLSKASAWTIVLILAFIGLTFRIVSAYFSGNPS
jgi:hypothetical protein